MTNMATSSFGQPLKIETEEAADALIKAMENPTAYQHIDREKFRTMMERGEAYLKKRSSL